MIILYRRFGTTYRSHLQGSRSPRRNDPLKMGQIRCPETSVKDYHSTMHNTAEGRSSEQEPGLQKYVHTVASNVLLVNTNTFTYVISS
jgi:hypothetical protein